MILYAAPLHTIVLYYSEFLYCTLLLFSLFPILLYCTPIIHNVVLVDSKKYCYSTLLYAIHAPLYCTPYSTLVNILLYSTLLHQCFRKVYSYTPHGCTLPHADVILHNSLVYSYTFHCCHHVL